jgi:hypothetical protein
MTPKPLPYQLRLATALLQLRLTPGLSVCRVKHRAWCPKIKGKPKCRCRPEITIETAQGNVRVMDDGTICLPATSN